MLIWLLVASSVTAFDSGHHADLIGNALRLKGYSGLGVMIAQERSWLLEYFGLYERANETSANAAPFEVVGFDNDTAVRSYFNRLANATDFALEQIAASNATSEYFLLLGATLHAIQNFYAHSNWVELNPRKDCACFGTSSFFDAVPNNKVLVPPLAALGSYCNGTNKDSYARPLWEEAYAFAFVASFQWIDMFEALAARRSNGTYPLLARQPLAFVDETLATSVASDLYYQYRLSLWGAPELAHAAAGRYKGPLSALPFGYEIAKQKYASVAPKLFYYSRFSSAGAKWEQLAAALRAPLPSTPPPAFVAPPRSNDSLPFDVSTLHAVIVRTLRVASLGGGAANDTADFYAELDVGDALYREATQYDRAASSPAWSTIVVIGLGTPLLNISYTLKDADSFAIANDELVRISGANATIRFTVNKATGAVSGDISGPSGTNFTTKGTPVAGAGGAAAEVTLSVRVVPFSATCTGAAVAPSCHVPGAQVCSKKESRSRVIAASSTLHAPLLLSIAFAVAARIL